MNVQQGRRKNDQADSNQHEDHALSFEKGLPEIDGGNGVRNFGNSQRCQVEQEAIAQDTQQVARDFGRDKRLEEQNVDEFRALTDRVSPAGDFLLTDDLRNGRAAKKPADAEGEDAAQAPPQPKECEAAGLSPGVYGDRCEQGAGEERYHCREHGEQYEYQHAEERRLRDYALGPDDDFLDPVVHRVRCGDQAGDDDKGAQDQQVTL